MLNTNQYRRRISSIPWKKCIAKTNSNGCIGYTVEEHSRIVAAVAKHLLYFLPSNLDQRLRSIAIPIASIHDAGKISPGFQMKISRENLIHQQPSLIDIPTSAFNDSHTTIGSAALNRFLRSSSEHPIAQIVAMHHGDLHSVPMNDSGDIYGGEAWMLERESFVREMMDDYGHIDPAIRIDEDQRDILTGFVCTADWIGSDETLFPQKKIADRKSLDEIAELALKKCGFQKPTVRYGLKFSDLFEGWHPRPAQQTMIETVDGPGLYIFEAPMGLGKTEAALYSAYKLMKSGANQGLYFGLPTRLTSNRIHERVERFLSEILEEDIPAKLAHGAAWLDAFRNGGEGFSAGAEWFNPRKRALLYPFGVGTIDQALLGVIRTRHWFMRMFGLAGKVVILDEVHSYDIYTSTLLKRLVEKLLKNGCTVIVLSATLTSDRRSVFFPINTAPAGQEYPIVSRRTHNTTAKFPAEAPADRSHRIRLIPRNDRQVVELPVEKARSGHCVLCIANTVASAQDWYRLILTTMADGEFPVALLHSRFPGYRRSELENEWIEKLGKNGSRPRGCVLVATQVVEQSVDIDADFLITELAPTDMLLQRMGRQWRHDGRLRPTDEPETVIVANIPCENSDVHYIREAFGPNNCRVYDPYILWRTAELWQSINRIALPSGIRELIESTYRESEESDAVQLLHRRSDAVRLKLEKMADSTRVGAALPFTEVRAEDAVTRYSDFKVVPVLLTREFDERGHQADITLLRSGKLISVSADRKDIYTTAILHDSVVRIAAYSFADRLICRPDCLRKHFHEPIIVLVRDEETGKLMHPDGTKTGLGYRDDLGVFRVEEQTGVVVPEYRRIEYDDAGGFTSIDGFDW